VRASPASRGSPRGAPRSTSAPVHGTYTVHQCTRWCANALGYANSADKAHAHRSCTPSPAAGRDGEEGCAALRGRERPAGERAGMSRFLAKSAFPSPLASTGSASLMPGRSSSSAEKPASSPTSRSCQPSLLRQTPLAAARKAPAESRITNILRYTRPFRPKVHAELPPRPPSARALGVGEARLSLRVDRPQRNAVGTLDGSRFGLAMGVCAARVGRWNDGTGRQ
jgi:hypothetical protein